MTDREHPDPDEHDCYVAPISKAYDPERLTGRAVARLGLAGLGCPNCAARVHNALLSLDGVIEADVSLSPQRAVVTFDPGRTLPEQLAEAVYWAGAASRHRYHAEILAIDTPEAPATGSHAER